MAVTQLSDVRKVAAQLRAATDAHGQAADATAAAAVQAQADAATGKGGQ